MFEPPKHEVAVHDGITVKQLSERLAVKPSLVIKSLLDRGIFTTPESRLGDQLACEVVRDFGRNPYLEQL
jgi:hypothetical protein